MRDSGSVCVTAVALQAAPLVPGHDLLVGPAPALRSGVSAGLGTVSEDTLSNLCRRRRAAAATPSPGYNLASS